MMCPENELVKTPVRTKIPTHPTVRGINKADVEGVNLVESVN
jgi:hypothetical protein